MVFTFLGYRFPICKNERLKYNSALQTCGSHFTCIISSLHPHNNFVREVQNFYSSHLTDKETETQSVIICQVMWLVGGIVGSVNPRAQGFSALKFWASKNATNEQNTSVGYIYK